MKEDDQLKRIQDRATSKRMLRHCLMQLPNTDALRAEHMIKMRDKNGLDAIAIKAGNGRWYVNVDDFIDWMDRGMKKTISA